MLVLSGINEMSGVGEGRGGKERGQRGRGHGGGDQLNHPLVYHATM